MQEQLPRHEEHEVCWFPSSCLGIQYGKLELCSLDSQAGAWEPADVGRNKSARRQQGRMFPAIGAPETPVLRLTRGMVYSGLRLHNHQFKNNTKKSTKFLPCFSS